MTFKLFLPSLIYVTIDHRKLKTSSRRENKRMLPMCRWGRAGGCASCARMWDCLRLYFGGGSESTAELNWVAGWPGNVAEIPCHLRNRGNFSFKNYVLDRNLFQLFALQMKQIVFCFCLFPLPHPFNLDNNNFSNKKSSFLSFALKNRKKSSRV